MNFKIIKRWYLIRKHRFEKQKLIDVGQTAIIAFGFCGLVDDIAHEIICETRCVERLKRLGKK